MSNWQIVLILVLLAAVLFLVFAHDQNKRIVITKYEIEADVVHPFRIAHLSDLHSTCFKGLLPSVKAAKPDMLVITGDLINDKGKNRPQMLAYVEQLAAVCPVFYVTGNHERRLADFSHLMEQISQAGAHVLRNRSETVIINENPVIVLGLDEKQGSFDDYKEMIKGGFQYRDNRSHFHALGKKEGFKLVLTHFPENFACIGDKSYQQFDFDLMLAGHAHGGQFNLPLIGPVFSPGQGLFPKYAKGCFGQRPKLIVSRGMGNSEFPLRLFNHPELILIEIHKKSQP